MFVLLEEEERLFVHEFDAPGDLAPGAHEVSISSQEKALECRQGFDLPRIWPGVKPCTPQHVTSCMPDDMEPPHRLSNQHEQRVGWRRCGKSKASPCHREPRRWVERCAEVEPQARSWGDRTSGASPTLSLGLKRPWYALPGPGPRGIELLHKQTSCLFEEHEHLASSEI